MADRERRRGAGAVSESGSTMSPGSLPSELARARNLHAAGRFDEAEHAYRQSAQGPHREAVLQSLSELYMQAQRPDQAIEVLTTLVRERPDSLFHTARLATVLDGFGMPDRAMRQYRALLERQPDSAGAWFNLALLCKKEKRYAEAVAAYEKAAKLGIDHVEEVWSNLGVLYAETNRPKRAAAMYERALDIDPAYVPALFNRAGLHEEAGERAQAVALYQRVLEVSPGHWESLARIAHSGTATRDGQRIVRALQRAIDETGDGDLPRTEGLHFAFGKALEDLQRYDEAFAAYRRANETGSRLRNRPYLRDSTEKAIDRLIELFDAEWLEEASTETTASPIFICGMFRSGSTLVEHILGGHSAITAGGELDFLPWLLTRRLSPYPEAARKATPAQLQSIAAEYLARVRELFPGSETVTDKRPDNFLHLGIVKALFPHARIIYTKRDALDNCLSLYCQHLGGNLTYATDLSNAAHYYRQHERLMNHWASLFAENIFTVDYDRLVREPEPLVREMLAFLGLEEDDRGLDFTRGDHNVRTASIWQVRDPLHTRSSGRWRRYEPHVAEARAWLEDNPAA